MKNLKETVAITVPVYNMDATIKDAIASILNQTFKDFYLIIIDNASTDNTVPIIKSIKDKRIHLYINKRNIGASANIVPCFEKSKADIIIIMAADDILEINAVKKIYNVFLKNPDIAVINRSYRHFDYDPSKPTRIMHRFEKNQIISIDSDYKILTKAIDCSCQLSGMAFRKKYLKKSYIDSSAIAKPFVSIPTIYLSLLKHYKSAIIKDDIVACRTTNNTIVKEGPHNKIFQSSPSASWHDMMEKILPENKFKPLKKYFDYHFIGNNYIGLIQIKNYGGMKKLIEEIIYIIKIRKDNLVNPIFWFYSLGCILTPRFILISFVAWYKNKINSKFIEKTRFEYNIKLDEK
jgi:glycosyltransferase involved in cell wall biosynthesis